MIGLSYGNFQSGAGFDPDASAFITAAGITGQTQQAALNQLVLDLKGEGSTTNNSNIWSKFHALYPYCPIDGSTATENAYKWNLVDPRDLDAAFRMTWNNSPTVDISGVTGNGTNAYGNTHFKLSTNGDLNNFGMTLSRTTAAELGGVDVDFGATDGNITNISLRNSNILAWRVANSSTSIASTDGSGIYTGETSTTTDHNVYKNGTLVYNSSAAKTGSTAIDIYFLARNNSGTAGFFVGANYNFTAIHQGMTANEAKDLYDSILKYNTALGR